MLTWPLLLISIVTSNLWFDVVRWFFAGDQMQALAHARQLFTTELDPHSSSLLFLKAPEKDHFWFAHSMRTWLSWYLKKKKKERNSEVPKAETHGSAPFLLGRHWVYPVMQVCTRLAQIDSRSWTESNYSLNLHTMGTFIKLSEINSVVV